MNAALLSRYLDHMYVFVLMLENRSFDQMLGFSGITGIDAATGQPTRIDGLTGAESNNFEGKTYVVRQPAGYAAPVDPGHEFPAVLTQLCGQGATYSPGAYPRIINSGFVASYATSGGQADPGEIMRCYGPEQLPVLNALAREFAVCDRWFAPMPGPTWPNRFFVHAASAAGLDHSPTTAEIILWESLSGLSFSHGTIFDRMNASKVSWRLYAGDAFPMVAALKGIQLTKVHPFRNFPNDVADPRYAASYTFIEPSYNVLSDYKCSTSQHPLDDVTRGESLIKCVYETLRSSPLWSDTLLILTWDEHGGFYDHVAPPRATAPADTAPNPHLSQYGFHFRPIRRARARGGDLAAHPAQADRSSRVRSHLDPEDAGGAVRHAGAYRARPRGEFAAAAVVPYQSAKRHARDIAGTRRFGYHRMPRVHLWRRGPFRRRP
jgi:phospholipase C